MAVVQNTLIGRTRGSIGGVVFTTQFGFNVAKSKPVSVAQPNSDKQRMQKSAMSQITAIARQILGVIQVTFNALAVGKSAYNVFSSLNLRTAFDFSNPPTAVLLPSSLVISKGTIAITPVSTAVVGVGGNSIDVTFPNSVESVGQSLTDVAVVVAFNETNGKAAGWISGNVRSMGECAVDITLIKSTNPVYHLYLAFISEDGSKSSDSVHSVVPFAGN